MADHVKPIFPVIDVADPIVAYIEDPPDAIPDIGATNEPMLIWAWNGTGPFAKDNKQRRNYRVTAVVHQSEFLMVAATKKSGITDLSQVKDRRQPTWLAFTPLDQAMETVLDYYGITEDGLKSHGGGFLRSRDRQRLMAADLFIGGGMLADTPEHRMWYQASQLDDLTFFELPAQLQTTIVAQGIYHRATAPIALFRGVERPIPSVMRSTNFIYVRDDAPDWFTYAVAKALDEHQDLFRLYGTPLYYDIHSVASSAVIPMARGAMQYYRERGYVR